MLMERLKKSFRVEGEPYLVFSQKSLTWSQVFLYGNNHTDGDDEVVSR